MSTTVVEKLKHSFEHRQAMKNAIGVIRNLIENKESNIKPSNGKTTTNIQKEKEDASARFALGEITKAEFESTQKNLQKQMNEIEGAHKNNSEIALELNGLNRRLADALENEDKAIASLVDAEADWIRQDLANAEEEYTKHAAQLKASYLRIMACISALTSRKKESGTLAAYSGEIMLPIMGECSKKSADPRASYSGYFFKEKRPVFDYGNVNIDWEIADIVMPKEEEKNFRFGKIVASIGRK